MPVTIIGAKMLKSGHDVYYFAGNTKFEFNN